MTDASVHDSQALENLLEENDEDFLGDYAYSDEKQQNIISQKEMIDKTCKKGYRNNPLNEQEIASNIEKSRIHSRVEHVFAFMEGSMNRMNLYAIGIKRVEGLVGFMNLTYNMFRKIKIQTI